MLKIVSSICKKGGMDLKKAVRASLWHHEEGIQSGIFPAERIEESQGRDGFTILAYNMRRAINILGVEALLAYLI